MFSDLVTETSLLEEDYGILDLDLFLIMSSGFTFFLRVGLKSLASS